MPKRGFYRTCLAVLVALPMVAGAWPVWAQRVASAPQAAVSPTAPAVAASPLIQLASIGDTVTDIHIDGTERLEPETVISYLTFGKGDQATQDKIDASLKALYATGLFKDIDIEMEGSVLSVKVTENPIINRITFEGEDAISKDDLEKEIQLKPRLVYTLPRVQRDVQRILDLYRRQGRFAAVVVPKIVQQPQNRVDLVFEITEGKRTGIRSINFVGNEHFDNDELHEAISTRESAWWRFFSNTAYYDPDRMNYDRDLLRRFYLNEGYVDFRVLSSVAELTPDREDFFITFTVEEGPRYKFGQINIKSEIKGLDAETLRQYLTTRKGDWYSADQIDKSVTALTTVLGDKQYAFANIVPTPDRHKEDQRVDITYDIKQGERVYIGRINVSGNTRTADKVIRREMQLAEGDPFSATKLHLSEQKLKDLNFFKTAEVKPVDGTQPDRADLNVKLEEKSTGEISIGAGYSSTDGPLGDFNIHESNFMGQGQDARVGVTVSSLERQFTTSFTEPYFLDRDLSAGVDLFHTQSLNQDLSSYDETSSGFTLRMGYPLSQELRQKINYSFHYDNINDVPSTASLFIIDQQGASTTSSFGQELDYDTRDSKLNPTKGFITHLNTDIAGAGGSRKWARVRFGGTQYYPLADKWVISGMGEVGEIWGLGGPTLINERFYVGGDTLRGFQYAGIGPRDLTDPNQDALGGDRFTRATAELQTPTPFPPEFGLKGRFFVDAGTLGSAPLGQAPVGDQVANDESLHLSAGIGVTWDSPFGPVRLDYAEPILYKTYDKLQHIHFSFGTSF